MPITRADLDEIKMRARERVAEWLTNYVNQMDAPYIRATNNALAEQAQQQSTPGRSNGAARRSGITSGITTGNATDKRGEQ